MDSSKKPNNKIREIVRLQQILKKWRKLANSSSSSSSSPSSKPSCNKKSIQLILKRTLSFSDKTTTNTYDDQSSSPTTTVVPKGYLAVCVGEEQKRFVIPTEYLGRRAFQGLLREAEEEFGFEQTGVLRIPCQVSVFERVLKGMESEQDSDYKRSKSNNNNYNEYYHYYCTSNENQQLGFSHHSDHSSLCR